MNSNPAQEHDAGTAWRAAKCTNWKTASNVPRTRTAMQVIELAGISQRECKPSHKPAKVRLRVNLRGAGLRNNRIGTSGFLNQCCAFAPNVESILLARMRKNVFATISAETSKA